MSGIPSTAMVFSASLGKHMRPITDTIPKPLMLIADKKLLDWWLDSLAEIDVEKVVVNVHYFPDQIVAHVSDHKQPRVVISDERAGFLDSAGCIVKASEKLSEKPFYILNADTFWVDPVPSNLTRFGLFWDASRMDILTRFADLGQVKGHSGSAYFFVAPDDRLSCAKGAPEGVIYAEVVIIHPCIFKDLPAGPASLNRFFDDDISSGRLFGMQMHSSLITVGTPDAIAPTEATVKRVLREEQ